MKSTPTKTINSETIIISKDGSHIIEGKNLKKGDVELKINDNLNVQVVFFNNENNITINTGDKTNCSIFIISNKDSEQKVNIGKDCDVSLYNLLGMNGRILNITTTMNHTDTGSKSLMLSKAVLRKSNVHITGNIKIQENAFKSNGYQKTEILILDQESKASSVPNLEIHNHDVKCTHSSTITRLDAEKIFYLKSRGLNEEQTQELMVNGFFSNSLSALDEELKSKIEQTLLGDLNEK